MIITLFKGIKKGKAHLTSCIYRVIVNIFKCGPSGNSREYSDDMSIYNDSESNSERVLLQRRLRALTRTLARPFTSCRMQCRRIGVARMVAVVELIRG